MTTLTSGEDEAIIVGGSGRGFGVGNEFALRGTLRKAT